MAIVEEPVPGVILQQVERILRTSEFSGSHKLARFLSFVVDETLEGRASQIKGYTIAVSVYDRPETFDPQTDPIVRVEARRLRRALEHYYLTEGRSDPVHIEIPKGTYVPTFTENGAPALSADTETAERPDAVPSPSIAVLPFARQGDDEKAAYLANGITEELTVSLSKYQGLTVIAHQSTVHLTQFSVGEVAGILGVRFVLTGSVLQLGEKIRVVAQLTDATDESVIWADTMRRDLSTAGVFEILDEITQRIVGIIGDEQGIIFKRLAQETRRRSPQDLSVYEASLLYYHYHIDLGRDEHGSVLEALERAVKTDPTYVLGWAQLAGLYIDVHAWGFPGPAKALDLALSCARKAIALDPQSQEGHAYMAGVRFLLRHHEEAVREAELAITINPSNAFLVSYACHYMGMSGELERGYEVLDGVDGRNPYLPGWLRITPYLYRLEKRQFEHALHEAHRFKLPNQPWEAILRAVAAAHLGNESVAADAYRELEEDFPDVAKDPTPTIRVWLHFDHWVETMLEGLAKARKFSQK